MNTQSKSKLISLKLSSIISSSLFEVTFYRFINHYSSKEYKDSIAFSPNQRNIKRPTRGFKKRAEGAQEIKEKFKHQPSVWVHPIGLFSNSDSFLWYLSLIYELDYQPIQACDLLAKIIQLIIYSISKVQIKPLTKSLKNVSSFQIIFEEYKTQDGGWESDRIFNTRKESTKIFQNIVWKSYKYFFYFTF